MTNFSEMEVLRQISADSFAPLWEAAVSSDQTHSFLASGSSDQTNSFLAGG